MPGLTNYRGLQVPSDTPTGAAGAALKDDLVNLVDWSPKSNYAATTDPTVDDDETAYYYPGSLWLNTTSGTFFLCASSADGSAVWTEVTSGSPADYVSTQPSSSARNTIVPASAAIVPLTLKGAASQSADLLQIKDASDNLYFKIDAGCSVFAISSATSVVPLTIKAASGQTADLLQVTDSSGVACFRIDAACGARVWSNTGYTVPLTLKTAPSQSADVFQITDNSGTVQLKVDNAFGLTCQTMVGSHILPSGSDSKALVTDTNRIVVASSVTATELGYLSGVTSAIQTQLGSKQNTISLTGDRAVATDSGGALAASSATAAELGYLSGVTSAIQTQLNAKAATSAIPTATSQLTNDSGFITGTSGFSGTGAYTNFTIVNGLITSAS